MLTSKTYYDLDEVNEIAAGISERLNGVLVTTWKLNYANINTYEVKILVDDLTEVSEATLQNVFIDGKNVSTMNPAEQIELFKGNNFK